MSVYAADSNQQLYFIMFPVYEESVSLCRRKMILTLYVAVTQFTYGNSFSPFLNIPDANTVNHGVYLNLLFMAAHKYCYGLYRDM